MSANKHTGDVPFEFGDLKGTLRFDWRALAEAQTYLGKALAGAQIESLSVEQIANLLVIGSKRLSPHITVDAVMEASPPLLKVIGKINEAAVFAYFGADGVPADTGESDPKA